MRKYIQEIYLEEIDIMGKRDGLDKNEGWILFIFK